MSASNKDPLADPLDAGAGKAQSQANISFSTFLASLSASAAVFAIEFAVFWILKGRLTRIYTPKTYLVPERERTQAPPHGLIRWIIPVFKTSNSEFINKCGLDAYLFLRYLRLLLKIFFPLACIILPILLPINRVGEKNGVTGLDTFGWQNIGPTKTDRYWAHLILSILVVVWVCYNFYVELRRFIRLRQAYLTSPQHRLRASATTVLVTNIPRKWLNRDALDALYDVFPGGIRQIWINHNFDELNEKVKLRDWYHKRLEAAYTVLVLACIKRAREQKERQEKEYGLQKSRAEKKQERIAQDRDATERANEAGISSGDPHQIAHTLEEALDEEPAESSPPSPEPAPEPKSFFKTVGDVVRGVGHIPGRVAGGHIPERVAEGQQHHHHLDELVARRSRRDDRPQRLSSEAIMHPPHAYPGIYANNGVTYVGRYDGADEGTAGVGRYDGADSPSEDQPQHDKHDVDEKHPVSDGQLQDGVDRQSRPHRRLSNQSETSIASDTGSVIRHFPGQENESYSDPRLETTRSSTSNGLKPLPGTPAGNPQAKTVATDEKQASTSHVAPATQKKTDEGNNSQSVFKRLLSVKRRHTSDYPSPQPFHREEDEFPLGTVNTLALDAEQPADADGKVAKPTAEKKADKHDGSEKSMYSAAWAEDWDDEKEDEHAVWKKYIKVEEREVMRIPLFNWNWWPSIPFIGKEVDCIYYCRKELARLNAEIETDQEEEERFPLMNSAFIQFNHQVAAHMACQSLNHHIPQNMAPRMIEIDPNDVLWDNLSVKWWERYLRTTVVIAAIVGLTIAWAIPVTFTGLLSQISYLITVAPWLGFLRDLPKLVLSIIQGILPPVLLAGLLALLPIILRFLARQQGVQTGMLMELSVQNFYFFFLFVQVFLVVSISSGISATISKLINNPLSVTGTLATNLPKASNYFFNYMIIQALTVSAGALMQTPSLVNWFLLAPLFDATPRQKWKRQITLPQVQWGTFFPVYTNLAAIGLIYSVISPLILIFNCITFSLFWIVYRYQTLYVNRFTFDTGGLLFPKAINQLFTGLYVMELCLIGLFFLVRDERDRVVCTPHGIIMIVVLFLTIIYQYLLNNALSPLYRYVPITMEDEAVARDEEFARAQSKRWKLAEEEQEGDNIQDVLEERERREQQEEADAEKIELQEIERAKKERRQSRSRSRSTRPDDRAPSATRAGERSDTLHIPTAINRIIPSSTWRTGHTSGKHQSWADRSNPRNQHSSTFDRATSRNRSASGTRPTPTPTAGTTTSTDADANTIAARFRRHHRLLEKATLDVEAQAAASSHAGDLLYSNVADEIEDLTADERDKLVQRAFQHEALRARRPCVWIPRDELGVSDYEIQTAKRFSAKNVWIDNSYTRVDSRMRVVFGRAPPDFSEVDLIKL